MKCSRPEISDWVSDDTIKQNRKHEDDQDYWGTMMTLVFVELDWLAVKDFNLVAPCKEKIWVCSASETDSLWA